MTQNKIARNPLVYAAQIRAARGLLNWSQGELAERAGVSKQSVTRIENGTMDPRFSTITALYQAIRSAGVEMAEDVNGTVRLTVSREKLLPLSAKRAACKRSFSSAYVYKRIVSEHLLRQLVDLLLNKHIPLDQPIHQPFSRQLASVLG